MTVPIAELKRAVQAALDSEWDKSHKIVQGYNTPTACRIHAVLHKIEGDAWNSRYWYARTSHKYEEYADPQDELRAILRELENN
ncbi:MAG: hypothetical protein LBE24_01250 [Methylobacillus sp.]|jgi:hypothetical protein|nr:hypothetical protein [Methylobacillus sp.]